MRTVVLAGSRYEPTSERRMMGSILERAVTVARPRGSRSAAHRYGCLAVPRGRQPSDNSHMRATLNADSSSGVVSGALRARDKMSSWRPAVRIMADNDGHECFGRGKDAARVELGPPHPSRVAAAIVLFFVLARGHHAALEARSSQVGPRRGSWRFGVLESASMNRVGSRRYARMAHLNDGETRGRSDTCPARAVVDPAVSRRRACGTPPPTAGR